jgi:hypothetical protein
MSAAEGICEPPRGGHRQSDSKTNALSVAFTDSFIVGPSGGGYPVRIVGSSSAAPSVAVGDSTNVEGASPLAHISSYPSSGPISAV